MPDELTPAGSEPNVLKPAKKRNSAAARVQDMAARFMGYLELNGGAALWLSYIQPNGELGEAYDAELEQAVFEGLDAEPPNGWKPWNFAQLELDQQPSMLVRSVRAIKDGPGGDASCFEPKAPKPVKPTKVKKEQEAKDLRSMFERKLAALRADPSPLQKEWMPNYTLTLIASAEQLQAWVTRIQSDFSLWREVPVTPTTPAGTRMPVVAVDTETFGLRTLHSGLDTRLVLGRPQLDCAGICLCADGMVALYVPLNHEGGPNLDRVAVRRILQPLFDSSYLVFFNSKFDREVGRLTLGLSFRDYPFYEDVQNDNFLLDPKTEVDEEISDFGGEGLKDLAERDLGIEQIALSTLTVVRAQYFNPKLQKKTYKNLMAPFSWVPTDLAVLYAAPDALTTWLLWEKKHKEAQTMGHGFPFKLDHLLVDSLAWMERQRFKIHKERWEETVALHHRKMEQFRKQLCQLSGMPDFNPGSPGQLADVLFSPDKLGFKKGKLSEKTGAASTDKSVVDDLKKAHPNHPFLIALSRYRSYASLHPSHLEYDPRDMSARMFFKQCTVAGGRLAAMGGGSKEGKGKDDGGFGLNPQAIKGVKGLHEVEGREILFPNTKLAEVFDPSWLPEIPVEQLHESVLKRSGDKIKVEAPDLINGVAHYMGLWWSFRPEDVLHVAISPELQNEFSFADVYDLKVDPLRKKVDSNEVINLRHLFVAPEGYTLCVVDYSNIEMRVAANVSKEPKFIDEFLTGSGDFHTLTAKAVFPEFSTTKDKVLRKELRSLAKIINFALLYGGTEHAIFMNMKTQDPTITKEKATAMVDTYWAAVPMFAEWTYQMRKIARETLTCTTPDGRRIDFRSVLAAEGLHAPSKEDYKNVQKFWKLKRQVEEFEQEGNLKAVEQGKALIDARWKDEELGIRNASEYKKMVGKFERVAVNAPLQGLAGDLMRRALTLLHRWAENAGVEGALLVHASVHDEIDFCIKNEFVPYILPRVTRLMKLRDMHRVCKWPVPIECDCEYGTSWDVKQHLTGDDGHVVSAYTKIPGLETYIPVLFSPAVEQQLIDSVASGNLDQVKEACAWLRGNLHPRVADVITRVEASWENPVEAKRCFIAACQLHEYWCIDEHEDAATDETLESYMARMGLERFPGLGEHVLSSIKMEELEPQELVPDEPEPVDENDFQEDNPESAPAPEPQRMVAVQPALFPVTIEARSQATESVVALLDEPEPEPVKPAKRQVPLYREGLMVMRELDPHEMAELQQDMGCTGVGRQTLRVYYKDGPLTFKNSKLKTLPERFQLMVDADE